MDHPKQLTCVEFFHGYGGNYLGLKRVIRGLQSIAVCERDAFVVANMVSKMEKGLMEPVPIWTDCKTFPSRVFKNKVGIFIASYPCQPFSAAGKRDGADDPRHLWPDCRRFIQRAEPELVWLENVEGHITLGLSTVLSDLEEDGYTSAWGIFSAAECGAPHQRKRVFILAYRRKPGLPPQAGPTAASRAYRRKPGPQGHAGDVDREGRKSGGTYRPASEGGVCGAKRVGLADSQQPASEQRLKPEMFRRWSHEAEQAGVDGFAREWPSRPGEPQHGWEPPRVVGNAGSSKSKWLPDERRECFSEAGNTCERSMGVASIRQDNGRGPGSLEETAEEGRRSHDASGSAGQGVGNAEDPDRRAGKRGAEEGAGQDGIGGRGLSLNGQRGVEEPAGDRRGRRGDGDTAGDRREVQAPRPCGERSQGCEAEPPLGGDADGLTPRLDLSRYSGLSDSELAEIYSWMRQGSNRIDELRMCGNGVVPATAERAWNVLSKELGIVI